MNRSFLVFLDNMSLTRFRFIIFTLVLAVFFSNCAKETRAPLITTTAPFVNDELALTGGAIVYAEGDAPILEKGICWSETKKTPDLNSSRKTAGKGAGSFTIGLVSVKPQTTYYIRAYATNKYGTAYGSPEQYISGEGIQLAAVSAAYPSQVTTNAIMVTGFIESDVSQVRETGFCWSDTGIPDITSSHLNLPLIGGLFTGTISGLMSNASYSVRAYARTLAGISYGDLLPVRTYFGTMTDQNGNTYNTIKIGNQVWMAENLRASTYRNGNFIPNISDPYNWSQNFSGACCSYNNQPVNPRNGLYYNFAAASNSLIAPLGWHVPTQLEFTTLINTLGGNQVAGALIKSADNGVWSDGITKNNPSGFNALPMGYRTYYGTFVNPTATAYFVSLSYLSSSQVFCLELNQTAGASMQLWDGRSGFSVRLVQD